jgi:hypothetical protein
MRSCLFCLDQDAKPSREHVWDDWLNRVNGVKIKQTVDFEVFLGKDLRERKWKSKSVDATAPVVCGTCNSGWMSDLTNQTKRTFDGIIRSNRKTCLLPLGIATIAAFTLMKWIAVDGLSDKSPRFSPAARRRFRQTLGLPSGTQVWIASYRNQGRAEGRLFSGDLSVMSGPDRGYTVGIFTYVVGFLAVQATFPQWTKPSRRPSEVRRLIQSDVWNRAALPIWPLKPTEAGVEWPPSEYLTSETVEVFHDRWRGLRSLRRRRL